MHASTAPDQVDSSSSAVTTAHRSHVLTPVIAIWRAPKGRSSRIWIFAAIGIIVILLSLLVAAGLLAPDS